MHTHSRYKYLIATLLLTSAHYVFAGASGTDVTHDNGWTGTNIIGTFTYDQNNTFTSSGPGNPALTFLNGYADITGGDASAGHNTFGVNNQTHINLLISGGTLDAGLWDGGTLSIHQLLFMVVFL